VLSRAVSSGVYAMLVSRRLVGAALRLIWPHVMAAPALDLHSRSESAWREIVARLGPCSVQESPFGFPRRISAQVGGFPLVIDESLRRGQFKTRATLTMDPVPWAMEIDLREGGDEPFADENPSFATGDEVFDARVDVHSVNPPTPASLRLALLDGSTRDHVLGLCAEGRLVVRSDSMSLTMSDTWRIVEPDTVSMACERLAAVAARLTSSLDLAAALASNATGDPCPATRLLNLRAFVRDHRKSACARSTLLAALHDPALSVRLDAALALGREGRELLLDLASRSNTREDVAIRALGGLDAEVEPEPLMAIIERTLNRRPDVARAAIDALARSPDGRAEPTLLRALASHDPIVRVVAAKALGHLGSVTTVPLLRAAIEADLLNLGFRDVAQEAIAAIKSRLHGASPGQVSLAEGETGQVSLTEGNHAGRVSVTEE
jgi:hypothetical protein